MNDKHIPRPPTRQYGNAEEFQSALTLITVWAVGGVREIHPKTWEYMVEWGWALGISLPEFLEA